MMRAKHSLIFVLTCLVLAPASLPAKKKDAKPKETPLDVYVKEAMSRSGTQAVPGVSPGSLWTPGSRLTDLGADVRATQVDDMVTIVVTEQATATSTGATKTSRVSSANASIPALAGVTRATGPWANLANTTSDVELNGQGATSRATTLTATLAGRVSHVLPNGYLVVEGTKNIQVNSEKQVITVRGVVRPADISPGNIVQSATLAQMEIQINGKGVVGDAIRRPNILYRILLGLLPF